MLKHIFYGLWKMQCKRPGGMTHGIIMAASSTEGSSQGEFIIINQKFIIINLQNSNYLLRPVAHDGEAGLWPEILGEKLKT